jgi:hypothetical protein
VKALKLPDVAFHALRHSHASALIGSGLDVLTVSRRLGHGNPTVTLTTHADLFGKTDAACREGNRGSAPNDYGTVIGGLGANRVRIFDSSRRSPMLSV